jgi:hypothetical protein
MNRWIAVFIFLYCGAAWSDADRQLECKNGSDVPDELTLSFKDKAFTLKNSERGCDSEYTYRDMSDKTKASFIFSAPGGDDMGLNAQNMIYAVMPGSNEAKYIGSIPVSAVELEDGSYKDIQQVGGSIYESVYVVSGEKISTVSPSKELVISGIQCVYQEKNDKACKKMQGSFKKPLCVLNYGERKVISKAKDCAGMSDNL